MSLLAVDLGIRTGFACYNRAGQLVWYRSHNYGSLARLRRGSSGQLAEISDLSVLVLEGGGPIADVWEREATRRDLELIRTSAEVWRAKLLYAREQRTGEQAKAVADELARRVIEWSDAPRPTSLRHDAAEAILLGLWAVVELGWLAAIPPEVRRR